MPFHRKYLSAQEKKRLHEASILMPEWMRLDLIAKVDYIYDYENDVFQTSVGTYKRITETERVIFNESGCKYFSHPVFNVFDPFELRIKEIKKVCYRKIRKQK